MLLCILLSLSLFKLTESSCAPHSFINRHALNIQITENFLNNYECVCENEPYKAFPPSLTTICWQTNNVCNEFKRCRRFNTANNVECIESNQLQCPDQFTLCPEYNLNFSNANEDGGCNICFEKNQGFDSGDVAWMLFATTFVMLQTPATGFLQGGLVRRKNTLSLISQSFAGVVIGCILWYIIGYSLTFGPTHGGFLGDSSFAFMNNISPYDCIDGQTIPSSLFVAFQMTFALMVPVLITGVWAEKFNFLNACLFMTIWPFLVYYPTAHWVWGGGWLTSEASNDGLPGVLDYAGGIAIHTSSGVASLVVAILLQNRRICNNDYKNPTSNIPLSMVGVALIWVGWYSFNGGSGLRANGQAIGALFVTQVSACFSSFTFSLLNLYYYKKIKLTQIASGALAGLAGITPASGYVESWVGIPYGIIVGFASFFGARYINSKLKLDDVLDVTSLQAIPGAVGSILVGFFATNKALPCNNSYISNKYNCPDASDENMGIFYGGNGKLLGWQILSVFMVSMWSAIFTYITMKIIHLFRKLDITPECEELGLDKYDHGEMAYDFDGPEDETSKEILVAKLCSSALNDDLKSIDNIIKFGIDPNQGDIDDRTILHIASANGSIKTVKHLVQNYNVKVNCKDRWGSTPLRDAQRYSRLSIIDYLKNHGAVLNYHEDDNIKFLDSCSKNHLESVNSYLKSGLDINIQDYDGRTGLHIAICNGFKQLAQFLINENIDFNIKDRWGNTAIDDGKRYKKYDLLEELFTNQHIEFIEKNEGTTNNISTSNRELLLAAKEGNLTEIKRLYKKHVDLFSKDYDGRTALHIAATNGHLNIISYLLTKKNCNVNVQDNFNNTPLKDALENKHSQIAKILKENGGILTNSNIGCELCNLVANNKVSKLNEKILQGIDLNIPDYDGRTALHIACSVGNSKIVKLLIENGAKSNIKDKWGGTALDDAVKYNNNEIVKIITTNDTSDSKNNDILTVI